MELDVERRLRRLERSNRMLMVLVALLAGAPWLGGRLSQALAQTQPQPQAKLPRGVVTPNGSPVSQLPRQLDNTQLLKALEPPPITPMVRTRALEIVDDQGKRRAWVATDADENALFGMFDAAGKLRVLLTVAPDAGLTILDRSDHTQAALLSGAQDRALGTGNYLKLTQGAVALDDGAGNHMVGLRLMSGPTSELWMNSAPGTRHISIQSSLTPGSSRTRIGELKLMAEDGVASAGFFTGAHIANVHAMGGVHRAGFEAGGERHMGFLRARSTVRNVQSEILAIPTRYGGDIQDLLHVEGLPP